MAKSVRTIPATVSRFTAAPLARNEKRKVAAYARVSTDHEEQLTSYDAQVDYYTNYIKSRDDWEFVGVYSDEGISGCNTKKREGFNNMVDDALAGKIQLIITKSVSRFARNTVDSLTTIRKLKENNIECYFEKENIWTFDGKGELLLTIMSSLAQEESRSISENVTWGQRKRFQDGKVSVAYGRFLGFERGSDGNLMVNHEEAKIIKRIYDMFLKGMTPYGIAKKLTADGVPSPGGKETWAPGTIRSILSNEKYKGDALLQKYYTEDFLTKKIRVNHGEIPQYYVERNHEAIIDPDVFDHVQLELERRSRNTSSHSGVHLFSSKLRCGQCGCWYGSKVWHSTTKYRRIIWQCNHKYQNAERCSTPHLTEDEVKDAFIRAANQMILAKDGAIEAFEDAMEISLSTTALEQEQAILYEQLCGITSQMEEMISQNAHIALNQTEYEKGYNALAERYDAAKTRLEELDASIKDIRSRKEAILSFIATLKALEEPITEFSRELWHTMVDYVTVFSKDDIRFTFMDGTEVIA